MSTQNIHLQGEDAQAFWTSITCINKENQEKINNFLDECYSMKIEVMDNGTIVCRGVRLNEDLD